MLFGGNGLCSSDASGGVHREREVMSRGLKWAPRASHMVRDACRHRSASWRPRMILVSRQRQGPSAATG